MELTGLITLVLVLALVGFVLWLILTKIPMDPTMKVIIQVVIVVVVVLWLLGKMGAGVPNLLR